VIKLALFEQFRWCLKGFGSLTLTASEKGLVSLTLQDLTPDDPRKGRPENHYLQRGMDQICEYFQGTRKSFDIPLDLQTGTPFEHKVWHSLQQIPYGQLKTYREIAQDVRCPNGARAVGLANHKNPLPLFIPCHRIIRSDGSLGGYGPGLHFKKKLLSLEKGNITQHAPQ